MEAPSFQFLVEIIQQDVVVRRLLEAVGLHGGADGHDLVRIDLVARVLAEDLANDRRDLRGPRLTADEQGYVDVDCDGQVTILDANMIANLAVGTVVDPVAQCWGDM